MERAGGGGDAEEPVEKAALKCVSDHGVNGKPVKDTVTQAS